jgi:ParB/RepB/Spo0J family partition protein
MTDTGLTETFSQGITRKAAKKGKASIAKQNERLEELTITYASVHDIQPNIYNPNRQSDHDFELLCKSMQEDGFTQPILVVKAGEGSRVPYTVVDGEHRWRAAQAIGMQQVPLVVVPMSEVQAKIATMRHNRARGSEDVELSAALMRDLRDLGALDWAADSLSLDDVELSRMLEDIPAPDALAGEEFSEAWEPGESTDDERIVREVGQNRVEGMTAAAIENMQATQRRVEEARTAEERIAARRDSDIFRLALVFAGDEAMVVREVLGNRPAERVLAMCRAVVANADVMAQVETEAPLDDALTAVA